MGTFEKSRELSVCPTSETAAEMVNGVDCVHFTHVKVVHHGDNPLSGMSLGKIAAENTTITTTRS